MNPLSKYGVSDEDIAKAIRSSAAIDTAINKFMEDEVVPYWRNLSPVRTGKYAASVKVIKKAKHGQGVVGAKDFKAHWIEYGTGEPGPTKALAPGEKTAHHFKGTLGWAATIGGVVASIPRQQGIGGDDA